MSADLLAEFDSFYQAPSKSQPSSTPASNDLSSLGNSSGNGWARAGGVSFQSTAVASKPTEDIWGSMSSFQPTHHVQQPVAQDDIWGAFGAAPSQNATINNQQNFSKAFGGNAAASQPIRGAITRRPTLEMFSTKANYMPNSQPGTFPKPQILAPSRPGAFQKSSAGGDILFDATDEFPAEDDDDEFGEFESVEPTVKQPPMANSRPMEDLFGGLSMETTLPKKLPNSLSMSTNLAAGSLPYPSAPKSPSFQERNPFSDLGLQTSKVAAVAAEKGQNPNSSTPVTVWPSFVPKQPDPYEDSPIPNNQLDEDWGDFEDLPAKTPAVKSSTTPSGIEVDAWGWDTADKVASVTPPVNVPPPTNIPPPSVLLSLFPGLFDLPQHSLFKAVSHQSFTLRNRILSDTGTIEFLRAYLLLATVAARIIAGRKLRWKRDTILSQAMKIGPAAAGGKGGMKLTGIDKSELVREDRESAEAVRIWKEQLGRLKSVVAVANTSLRDASIHLLIPEIKEIMHVKTKGLLAAPKPCVICGLKRDERIDKVDFEVEDSFGEWWTEHWGHRACRNFWQEHESKLRRH